MEKIIDYIEDSLAGIPDDGTLYRYKRKILNEMDERADEITHAGLKDEQNRCWPICYATNMEI